MFIGGVFLLSMTPAINCSGVSTTPLTNLSAVSLTLSINLCHGFSLIGGVINNQKADTGESPAYISFPSPESEKSAKISSLGVMYPQLSS
jgi:hypothetical protein